jgi:hypothetical protein
MDSTIDLQSLTHGSALDWPFSHQELKGSSIKISPLQLGHIPELFVLLGDEENKRLFKQVYLRPCKDLAGFRELMKEHLDSSHGNVTFTVIPNNTGRPAGWVLLHSLTRSPLKGLECALFLPEHQRSEHVFGAMLPIMRKLFEELEYDHVDFRRGSRVESTAQAGDMMGHTFVGVLRRRMLVKDRSQFSDLYSLSREFWPSTRPAVEGWLNANPLTP